MTIEGLNFPRGYFPFHPNAALNYQLNRLLPAASHREVSEAGRRISNLASWKSVMLGLAENAERQGRLLHASSYYRAAEFYMLPGDADKAAANERFLALFDAAMSTTPLERLEVPYGDGALPALKLAAQAPRRDILVVHGGFDSFVEELVLGYLDYPGHGIEVILFEGPGQGQALRRYHLTMDPAWEKPTAAVLDFFGITRCTLMGCSLGGYLAPRAAAFEPRIKRLVLNDVLSDFLDCFASSSDEAKTVAGIHSLLAAGRLDELDALAEALMAAAEMTDWVIRHGMAVCGAARPAEFFRWVMRIRTAEFSDRITQDVLLMAAAEDHVVPLHQFFDQARSLENAASLTAQLFTAADCAQNHCHVGNLALTRDYIRNWIDLQLQMASERQSERPLQAS